jgi:predicted Zn-dependent protease with MMP-like domain
MDFRKFENLVKDAVSELPQEVKERMNNVAICVEKNAEKIKKKEKKGVWKNKILLGLYQGVPQNVWGKGFGGNLPDKITIFKDSVEGFAKTEEDIKKIVKKTVYHEISHHFGFGEKKARELEEKIYGKNRSY